jgi:hypothetical protein
MPAAGTGGDRGTDHPVADVRRFPERHQVERPRPDRAFVHSLHFRISDTLSSQGRFMIAGSLGRICAKAARDHGLDE